MILGPPFMETPVIVLPDQASHLVQGASTGGSEQRSEGDVS